MTGKTKIITSHLSSDHEEVLVRGLHIHHVWKRQNDTIIDVRGTDKYENTTSSAHLKTFWIHSIREIIKNNSYPSCINVSTSTP